MKEFFRKPIVKLIASLILILLIFNIIATYLDYTVIPSTQYQDAIDTVAFSLSDFEYSTYISIKENIDNLKSHFTNSRDKEHFIPPTPGTSDTPEPTPQVLSFSAPTLGIQVTYQKYSYFAYSPANPAVKDNTLYFFSEDISKPAAFRIEVFNKDPQTDIATAVKNVLSQRYSASECPINVEILNRSQGTPVDGFHLPASYQVAQVFPADSQVMLGGTRNNDACPWNYIPNGHLNFFFMDTNHPSKLFFHEAGQESDPWTGELKFL